MTVTFDPHALDLKKLFDDPDMFESRDAFHDAGFDLVGRSSDSKIMAGSHRAAPGLLFKKYPNTVSQQEQHENYTTRIEGADVLRAFVDERRLEHIVVPQKWIVALPSRFSAHKQSAYILVVERLEIVEEAESRSAYYHIDKDVLRELCAVIFRFRGLDSNAKNIPFTSRGQLAFVDTEHWKRGKRRQYLKHIDDYLSDERRDLAAKMFDDLEHGRGGDFDDEEDTSSSSSSSSSF